MRLDCKQYSFIAKNRLATVMNGMYGLVPGIASGQTVNYTLRVIGLSNELLGSYKGQT